MESGLTDSFFCILISEANKSSQLQKCAGHRPVNRDKEMDRQAAGRHRKWGKDMKGYAVESGYMGYVNGEYMLFASETDYMDYVENWSVLQNLF